MHRYQARCSWRGSTAAGYRVYDRSHAAAAPPAAAALRLSADPAFRGDGELFNPEQLLVLAAASCQLLSFLAVAARAGVDVLAYDDDAEGLMPAGARTSMSITEITLRPRIVVGPAAGAQQVRDLVAQAHQECYVANSLRSAVRVLPSIGYDAERDLDADGGGEPACSLAQVCAACGRLNERPLPEHCAGCGQRLPDAG